jgi:hypothetical protein
MVNLPPFSPDDSNGIFIDGNFSDWNEVEGCADALDDQTLQSDVNIVDYRLFFQKEQERGWEVTISFYLEVEGYIFGNTKTSETDELTSYAVHIFIDSDVDATTGYKINGIGAELMVEIEGHNGVIHSSNLYEFDDTFNQDNWKGYSERTSILSAMNLHAIEGQVLLDPMSVGKIDVLFSIMDSQGNEDFSDTILSNEKGRLIVDQQSTAPEVISIGARDMDFLRLDLEAQAADIEVESINITLIGTAQSSDIDNISLVIDDLIIRHNRYLFKSSEAQGYWAFN